MFPKTGNVKNCNSEGYTSVLKQKTNLYNSDTFHFGCLILLYSISQGTIAFKSIHNPTRKAVSFLKAN